MCPSRERSGRRRQVAQRFEVDDPFQPGEGGVVTDRARSSDPQLAGQQARPPAGVHHPAGMPGQLALPFADAEEVRPGVAQLHVDPGDPEPQLEPRLASDLPQQLGLEPVAIELVGGEVRELAQERLAVALEAAGVAARGLPIEAEVVLEEVLAEQMLFEPEHAGEVVGGELAGRFLHLLTAGGQLAGTLQQQEPLDAGELQLSRQRQPRQPATEDRHVDFPIDVLHGLRSPCRPGPRGRWRAARRARNRSPRSRGSAPPRSRARSALRACDGGSRALRAGLPIRPTGGSDGW